MEIIRLLQLHWDLEPDSLRRCVIFLFWKSIKGGQGKKGHKKPVLFPKIVFLYDENLHGPGKPCEDIFEAGVDCSSKTMYPDWLSLTGKGISPACINSMAKLSARWDAVHS